MSKTVRALVVYESMFGNTERLARATGEGLRASVPADVVAVHRAPDVVPDDVRLLVVGGPTHAFSMSRESTRQEAFKQQDLVMPVEVGIREWLAALTEPGKGRQVSAATFDTRITKVRRLPGSAARSAAKVLRRKGYRVTTTENFFVNDTTGPIRDGELEHARRWGEELGRTLTGSAKVA